MIEVMFAVRKDGFKDHPAVIPELDLVEEDDQITHLLSIEYEYDGEDALNVFRYDNEFLENEERSKAIKEEILGGGGSSSESGEEGEEEDGEEEGEEGGGEGCRSAAMQIQDETHTNLFGTEKNHLPYHLSSLAFEEVCTQGVKWSLNQDRDGSGSHADRVLQSRALLPEVLWSTGTEVLSAQPDVGGGFDKAFKNSRIFVKILFQELAEYMGLQKLNERLRDPDDLREHLKNAPKLIMAQQHEDVESSDTSSGEEEEEEESSSSEESSSASGSDDGSSSSASEKEKKSAKKVKDKKGKIADNEGRKVKKGKKTDKDGAEPAKPCISQRGQVLIEKRINAM
eukprot:Em0015g1202a